MNQLANALNFRHACKVFDKTKKITTDDLDFILEAARKSPSAFGMEPWHFIVISDEKLKEELTPLCYNQPQINSCSHFVVALYRKANQFTMQSEYLTTTVKRNLPHSDANTIEQSRLYIANFCEKGLPKGTTVNNWSEMQAYIPCANIMTAAAYIGIDSCAISGFQEAKLAELLSKLIPRLSVNSFGVALCIALGYRANPQQPAQHRWPKKDIVTFL